MEQNLLMGFGFSPDVSRKKDKNRLLAGIKLIFMLDKHQLEEIRRQNYSFISAFLK